MDTNCDCFVNIIFRVVGYHRAFYQLRRNGKLWTRRHCRLRMWRQRQWERQIYPRRQRIVVPPSLHALYGKESSVRTFEGNQNYEEPHCASSTIACDNVKMGVGIKYWWRGGSLVPSRHHLGRFWSRLKTIMALYLGFWWTTIPPAPQWVPPFRPCESKLNREIL